MKNFGIEKLRLISPRDGWPNTSSYAISAGADDVLDNLECFESLDKASHDISLLIATTARKRVIGMGLQHIEAISKSKKANLHSIVDISNNSKIGFVE